MLQALNSAALLRLRLIGHERQETPRIIHQDTVEHLFAHARFEQQGFQHGNPLTNAPPPFFHSERCE